MTNIPFSAEETLKIAIEIEENGKEFYEGMVAEVEETEIVDLFKDLAVQEVNHKNTFREMLGEAELERGKDINSLLYGKLEDSYLEALADSKIFNPANENIRAAKQVDSSDELITVAISLEKDTILYYYEILENAKSTDDQELMKQVIEEEKTHVKRLAQLL
ncbi:MAG: ferritin family protein [Candidatus Bipolaricaulota bacterium]|nr:ferritin family protein [Candidatus Bipolaricaulota bacterium]MBS3791817.1 ferritin family protein [Candidatus Bipolaricaulota bacterium]